MKAEANLPLAAASARELWTLYGFESPSDLVLEDLAMAMGVVVVEDKIDSADAWLVRKGAGGIIRVSSSIPEPGRKRYAIAHELGHWQLHEEESQLRACTERDLRAKYKGSRLEVEANAFAAELLMPDRLFLDDMRGSDFDASCVERLAAQYGTSLTAAAVRYAELSRESVAIVVAKAGRIKWWRGSDSFRESYWIEANSLLGKSTAASMVLAGDARVAVPYDISVDEWVDDAGGNTEAQFVEVVVNMPVYGQTLSLLSVP